MMASLLKLCWHIWDFLQVITMLFCPFYKSLNAFSYWFISAFMTKKRILFLKKIDENYRNRVKWSSTFIMFAFDWNGHYCYQWIANNTESKFASDFLSKYNTGGYIVHALFTSSLYCLQVAIQHDSLCSSATFACDLVRFCNQYILVIYID